MRHEDFEHEIVNAQRMRRARLSDPSSRAAFERDFAAPVPAPMPCGTEDEDEIRLRQRQLFVNRERRAA